MEKASILYVILYSMIGSIFSLIGGIILLLGKNRNVKLFAKVSVPFAAGALLGAVFFDLLKEGIEESSADTVFISTLLGIVIFFAIERLTHWFHHHHEEDSGRQRSPLLIILADTLHNALDGVAIASAFLINVPTGIVTTIAIAAHEIPQEIGDFGVLLSKGVAKTKVLLFNLLSAVSTVVAAVLVYSLGGHETVPVGLLLGLSAGFLLYVAMSDLIPTIHEKKSKRGKIDTDLLLLILGVVVVAVAVKLAHRYIEH